MSRARSSLRGLVRLRTVRERDSRTGLATALTEEREVLARITELETMLTSLPSPAASDLSAFQGRQQTIEMIRNALIEARAQLEVAHQVSAAARDRWISDRSRLAAVESLVERRMAAVRAVRERREVRELDEIAEQGWRRAQLATASTDGGAA